MKKNYIEESILISVFTIMSFYIYEEYRLTYFGNEPTYSDVLLLFPLIILVTFIIIVLNKKNRE